MKLALRRTAAQDADRKTWLYDLSAPLVMLLPGLFFMHCAAWWLALASLFAPPLENHYDVR